MVWGLMGIAVFGTLWLRQHDEPWIVGVVLSSFPFFIGAIIQFSEASIMWAAISVATIVAGVLLGIILVQGHSYRLRKLELDQEILRQGT